MPQARFYSRIGIGIIILLLRIGFAHAAMVAGSIAILNGWYLPASCVTTPTEIDMAAA